MLGLQEYGDMEKVLGALVDAYQKQGLLGLQFDNQGVGCILNRFTITPREP